MLDALRSGVVRHTGWPPFWVPTRREIAPYPHDDNVECWFGRDETDRDPGHADYWRASPNGQFFLLRGYQEYGNDNNSTQPGEVFDLTIPTWRMGEVLLHAASMARQFNVPESRVIMIVEWTGLDGRRLVSLANSNRLLNNEYRSRQATCQTNIAVQARLIADMLPELVDQLVRPLYELFDFFTLPGRLVHEELARMRGSR